MITKPEFERLARFRRALRQFMRFSELAAREEGLTPQQHQMLLAIKGMPGRDWATITELAEALQLNHNAVVQLVDRAAALDLVLRSPDPSDRRVVHVRLTPAGEQKLDKLTKLHRDELGHFQEDLAAILTPNRTEAGDQHGKA